MTNTTDSLLPLNWRIAKIGDLFESWGGHTPSKTNSAYWGDGIPWISSKEVKGKLISTSKYSVTQKAIDETRLRVCPVGSVLVVVRSGILAHTLPVAVTEVPVTINQDLKAFFSNEPLMNDWLATFLCMSAPELLATSRRDGTTVQSVQYPLLKNTLIPIPSLAERRLILDAIDRVAIKKTSVIARLSVARRVVECFRQAALVAACSGRLTTDWREAHSHVSPARVVLANKRNQLREKLGRHYRAHQMPRITDLPEIPASWAWAPLPELGELGRGKSKHRPRNDPRLYGGPYPFIQTGDVARSDGRITAHSQAYNEVGLAQSRLWPERTVCITIAANIANSGLLTYPACFPDSVVGLIADEHLVFPEYVEFFMRTARRDLSAFAPATAQANINLAILSQLAVAVPPIEEQEEIIRRVSQMLSLADGFLARIDTASCCVDRTSQAVLAKAFRGDLH
ncbi:MAG: restriction endonuclease subunit S [Candidatus Dormibacteraceae bacterium]